VRYWWVQFPPPAPTPFSSSFSGFDLPAKFILVASHYDVKWLLMPNEVHCAHILVKTQTEAQAAMERLNKKDKFANVAREISICPSAKRGGDLGTFTRGKMVKEFEQAAFVLQKGQISPIVKTKFGYHIIKRLE
jgi:peptidyl-prolyl cis-trans isomerase C